MAYRYERDGLPYLPYLYVWLGLDTSGVILPIGRDNRGLNMALPNIRSVRKFYRELCASLRSEAMPWSVEMASAIETAMASPSKWLELPLFLAILYQRSYPSSLVLAGSLAAARAESPWTDLLQPKKSTNAVYGDIFDAFVKNALSTFPAIPGAQRPAKGGRSYDKGITVNGVCVAVEASVLGETNADRARWDAVFEKQRRQRKLSAGSGAYSGDPYELILRLTEKFLDKVAKNCDVKQCQLVADHPNLLFIGLPSLSAKPRDRDLIWAIDALFSEAPWERVVRDRVKDVWSVLERKVIEKQAADPSHLMAFDDFMKNALWDRFKRVSGIVVFIECRFAFGRINYHAHPANRITHSTLGAIEETLARADWRPFAVTTPL